MRAVCPEKPPVFFSVEYAVDVPQGLHAYVPPEVAKSFAPLFHQLGVPPKVATAITTAYAEHAQKVIVGRQQEYAEGREALKGEWGEATFNRRTALAERAVEVLLSDEQIDLFNKTGLSGHPQIVRLFAKLGEDMAEDGLIEGVTLAAPTVAAMQARKKEIEADPDFMSEKNPIRHKQLVQEWNSILMQLNPVAIG